MDKVIEIWNAINAHKVEILAIYTSIVTLASLIVKLTPTLKDDNALKSVISFIGKWIALDKYGPKGDSATNTDSSK